MIESNQAYTQFHNETPISVICSSPMPNVVHPAQAASQRPFARLATWSSRPIYSTRFLAFELIMSVAILIFGIASIALANKLGGSAPLCQAYTDVWAPIFGIVSSALGLCAFGWKAGDRSMCRTVVWSTHLALSIVSAVGFGVLIIGTCQCLATVWRLTDEKTMYPYICLKVSERADDSSECVFGVEEAAITIFTLKCFVLMGSLLNMCAMLYPSIFICRGMCMCRQDSPRNEAAGPMPVSPVAPPPTAEPALQDTSK